MMPQIFLGQGGVKCLAARAFLLSPDKSQLNLPLGEFTVQNRRSLNAINAVNAKNGRCRTSRRSAQRIGC